MRNGPKRAVLLLVAAVWLASPLGVTRWARPQPPADSGSTWEPQWMGQLPESVKLIADVPYAGTDNRRQRLDLVLPVERKDDPLPVVVYIHGGAWQAFNKSFGLPAVAPYVATGRYAGVSIGYRLSGEAQWPAQMHDCKAAIRWIRANADKYGLDGDRIGVAGDSAGGHLAAMLGTSGDVQAMDGQLGPHTNLSSRVACVVDFYGPTDFLQMDRAALRGIDSGHDSPDSPESRLIGGPIQENSEKVASASPITYVTADDPPFLIVHGTQDPIVAFNQSELLHRALAKIRVTSTLITVEGAGHGSGFGDDVSELPARFFAHHLRGERSEWEDQTIQAAP